ncbi:lipocalin family protein [Aquimarina intermedia]|uniref:Uncharacterized protein n=1 Tax=Aquimarina intermedia TaxID=350814 RepID=A0A5S5CC40_9FLAO|nr:lipocalin family protein [Aquimarina intermedia]TYP75906.1 hypothetical protein BD809_102115 [Aquimarina intermedia]
MKKSTYLITLFLALTFISCSKDDGDSASEPESSASLIAGDWDLTNFEIADGKSTLSVQGQTSVTDYSSTGKNFASVITFSENPNTLVSSGSFDTVIEMSVDGVTTFTQVVPGEDYLVTGTWKLEGDELTITNEALEQTDIANVLTLDTTTLIFEINLNRTLQVSGFPFELEGTAVYTLKRK